jgi:hypothetical protein
MILFEGSTSSSVSIRSSSRLKQKLYSMVDRSIRSQTTHECQTTDQLIEIEHRSSQTVSSSKIDKSTYTDVLDQAVCEQSTQTNFNHEQETQTTDLNCPHDCHVTFNPMTSNQTQCHGRNSIIAEQQQVYVQSTKERFQSTPYMDLSLNNHGHHDRLKIFQSLIHIEEHPNGGASLIRTYYNDYQRLSTENAHLFVNYFFNLVYGETNQRARYSIGVLHDGAGYLPDLVDYFSLTYPKMIVKTSNIFNSKEVLTTTMSEYRHNLVQSYAHGTFRYGPLMSISLVGTVTGREECGRSILLHASTVISFTIRA